MTATPRGLKFRRLTSGNRWNGNGFGYSTANYEALWHGEVIATFGADSVGGTILGQRPFGAGRFKAWREAVIERVPLLRSDLYADDPDAAIKQWGRLFRPVPANEVKVGSTVLCVETLFGFAGETMFAADEMMREGVVLDVLDDHEGTITIVHSGGSTEADELTEVWTRAREHARFAR